MELKYVHWKLKKYGPFCKGAIQRSMKLIVRLEKVKFHCLRKIKIYKTIPIMYIKLNLLIKNVFFQFTLRCKSDL